MKFKNFILFFVVYTVFYFTFINKFLEMLNLYFQNSLSKMENTDKNNLEKGWKLILFWDKWFSKTWDNR